MNFDAYWSRLVDRVHLHREELLGDEALFWRWSCIYGETMVDGIESYFERRFDQFDADMEALRVAGFDDVAQHFEEARQVIFGDAPLDLPIVKSTIRRLLDDSAAVQPTLRKIREIYDRIIPRLEDLAEHRYEFGLCKMLYSERDDH